MSEEKLKTLKDIELPACGYHCGCSSDECKDVMKQEAIKEIKFAKTEDGTKGLFGSGIDFMFTKDVIGYIKWKNNITKRDLK